MKPFALLAALAVSACVHASPLDSAVSTVSHAIAAQVNPAPPAEAVKKVERLSNALQPQPGTAVDWSEVFQAGVEAGKQLAKETAVAAPKLAEDVGTKPGPAGVLAAVGDFLGMSPTALAVIAMLLSAGLGFAVKHFLTAKQAGVAAPVLKGAIDLAGPIAEKTANPFDDIGVAAAKKVYGFLLQRAAQGDVQLAAHLADAHEAHGVPVPAPIAGA